MYDSLAAPPHSSRSRHFISRRKQVNALHTHLSTESALPAGATRPQQRLLTSLRSQCALFVVTVSVRSPVDSSAGPSDRSTRMSLKGIIATYSTCESSGPFLTKSAAPVSPDLTNLTLPDSCPLHITHSTAASAVVPLVANRVALPESLHIVPLLSVLPPSIAQAYADPVRGAALLRPWTQVLGLNVVAPLRPARVAGSRWQYIRLIRRMLAAGMIRFTSSPKAVNGVFTVEKDFDWDRLIIDARQVNRLFVDSPHVSLPNPSHLVQLRVPKGAWVVVGKSDLSNYYHHLGLPEWMVDYFALPPLTPEELAELGLPADAAFPACLTLPMGFSHAVYLAQMAHEHVVYRSGALASEDCILNMRSPDITADGVKHGIVVDDLFLFSLNRALAVAAFEKILAAYKAAGFVVKPSKIVWPTEEPVKVIGFMIGAASQSTSAERATTITLPAESSSDLAWSTAYLLRRGVATGVQLARLIGRWTWCMLLRRPSLAVLQHSYRFIEVADRRRFTLWGSVRRELRMLLGLLPLLHARLDVALHPNVIASDASEYAAGVVCTRLTPELDQRIWQLCSSKKHAYVQTLLNAAEQNGDEFSDEAAELMSNYAAFYWDVHEASWSTIISSPWRRVEHINSLELRAVLLALHWLLSYPSAHSSRVYLLVDSAVALYSLWKGRSSSAPLLLVLRRISALLLASGVGLLVGWLPSAVNPADEPSRRRITTQRQTTRL